jgi:hypothetical protein
MKRLIQLLAVSAGGGLLVGAGLRLAERRRADHGNSEGAGPGPPPPETREDAVERRLQLHIDLRLEAMEERLRLDSERRQRESADALREALDMRIDERISRIEAELAGQRASVEDLRDCSVERFVSVPPAARAGR